MRNIKLKVLLESDKEREREADSQVVEVVEGLEREETKEEGGVKKATMMGSDTERGKQARVIERLERTVTIAGHFSSGAALIMIRGAESEDKICVRLDTGTSGWNG